jgi:hypothetical protein
VFDAQLLQMMIDFHACSWPRPELNAEDASLAKYFDAMNDQPLQPVLAALEQKHAPALGRNQAPALRNMQPSLTPEAAGIAAVAAANGAAHSAADGPASGAQPAAGLNNQQHTTEEADASGHAVAVAVDALSSSSGDASRRPQMRPPIITFSHFLPHQVSSAGGAWVARQAL